MENKIRRARKKKGYTQEELACMVGCSVKTIIRWEKGENRVSFPGKEEKQCFPYSSIHRLHKSRRSCREIIKIKMFDVV